MMEKKKRGIRMLWLLVPVIFLSGSTAVVVAGCGGEECGPTSPARFCADYVSKQTGVVCTGIGTSNQTCTPVFENTCVRWDC